MRISANSTKTCFKKRHQLRRLRVIIYRKRLWFTNEYEKLDNAHLTL